MPDWPDHLSRGATVRDIVRAIAKSPEHLRRVGSQDRDDMVVDVYRHLLNRGPDPEALKNAGIFVSMRGSARRSSIKSSTRLNTGSVSGIDRTGSSVRLSRRWRAG